ncbi:MAG TPA: sigma-70 family RNA polymerase sigma factor [Solirubrobacteraceae bacterium]|nr:sigma-70 family RNA polymerase sigma factor [Solirubrobacteraceae bacterium]
MGDERLARRVGEGDERAFAAIYGRYHQQLYRYCRSLLRDDADAQDALQSAFTSALTALRRGRRDAPLRPWLYRIAHNEAITVVRRRRSHSELDAEIAGSSASPEEHAVGRERLATLVADLQELPERQRAALLMRELSGLSHEDIALALDTSPGAAKQTIFEARRSLQEFEEGRVMGCEEVCSIVSDGDGRALRGRRVRAHLRGCASCSAFAAAIPARRADLNAIAPPLAPALAGGLLAAVMGRAGAGHGAAGTAAGVAGKSAGLVLASKAVVGAAIIAAAGAGLSTTLSSRHHHAPARTPAHAVGPTRSAPTPVATSPVTSVAVAHEPGRGTTRAAARKKGAALRASASSRHQARPYANRGATSQTAHAKKQHTREVGHQPTRTRTRAHGRAEARTHEHRKPAPQAHARAHAKSAPAEVAAETGAKTTHTSAKKVRESP